MANTANTVQAQPKSGIEVFFVVLFILIMIAFFSAMALERFGFIRPFGPFAEQPAPGLAIPTPIIRIIEPSGERQPIVQPAPVPTAVPAPAIVAPAAEQPAAPPAPARQIIIVKQVDNPAAAPIVIDRGTKRKSP
jgi:hypothetical protein